ncbi:MAG TPA: hypothetical protein VMS96_00805 [Terriglobales bacterium]|nr:hypothetical protein [Terriglobales bacterium]
MKNMLAIALLLLTGAVSAVAQSSAVTAEVPFSFQAGNLSLAPGVYTLTRANDYGDRLIIRGADGRGGFLPSASIVQSPNLQTQGKLVFNHTDSGYVLSQVWIAGRNIGEQYAAPAASMKSVMARSNAATRSGGQ